METINSIIVKRTRLTLVLFNARSLDDPEVVRGHSFEDKSVLLDGPVGHGRPRSRRLEVS